jgi:hypothetical protein
LQFKVDLVVAKNAFANFPTCINSRFVFGARIVRSQAVGFVFAAFAIDDVNRVIVDNYKGCVENVASVAGFRVFQGVDFHGLFSVVSASLPSRSFVAYIFCFLIVCCFYYKNKANQPTAPRAANVIKLPRCSRIKSIVSLFMVRSPLLLVASRTPFGVSALAGASSAGHPWVSLY